MSPRLYTERLGLESGTWLPVAARWREVVPLAERTARVIYQSGAATFDGAPSANPYPPHAIPATRDRWQPSDAVAVERAAYKQLEALREERRRIVIPFDGWSEADCVAAIDALTKQVNEDFPRRAVNREMRIVFASANGEVGEERFFSEVAARFPGVAAAIRRLIDRYCDVAERNDFLFSRGEKGIGIFAWAVRSLGMLDRSALPTLRRYGVFVDVEHEVPTSPGQWYPAVIKAHGWTDDVVDFVFWVLARNFYNTLDDYGKVWGGWGLRDAVIHREPRAFARHIAADLAETIRMKDDPGRYDVGGLDQLAEADPPTPRALGGGVLRRTGAHLRRAGECQTVTACRTDGWRREPDAWVLTTSSARRAACRSTRCFGRAPHVALRSRRTDQQVQLLYDPEILHVDAFNVTLPTGTPFGRHR